MNVSPIAGILLPTAVTPTEPAPPGTVDADHGVAVEFAALLAGLLTVPVQAPRPTRQAPTTEQVALGGEPETTADVSAETDGTQATNGAAAIARSSIVAVPTVLELPQAPAAPTDGDIEPTEADAAVPEVEVDPEASTDAMILPTPATGQMETRSAGPAERPVERVTVDHSHPVLVHVPVPQPWVTAAGVTLPHADTVALVADVVVESIAPVPNTAEKASAAVPASPDVTEQPEPVRAVPETLADVVTRVADAVVTTVRRLMGREGDTADGAGDAEASRAEGELARRRSDAPVERAVAVVARGQASQANSGGGKSPDERGADQETRIRDVAAEKAGRGAAPVVLTDAEPLVAATAGASTPATPTSTGVSGGVAAVPVTPREPAPAPAAPQLVTVRFDGPGGVESRIRVAVRGDTVHATIITDAQSAPQLERSLPELQRSLADRGFSESRVSVRVMAGAESAGAILSRPELASGDGARQRDASDRHAAGREHADDDRPRGRRNQHDEEARS